MNDSLRTWLTFDQNIDKTLIAISYLIHRLLQIDYLCIIFNKFLYIKKIGGICCPTFFLLHGYTLLCFFFSNFTKKNCKNVLNEICLKEKKKENEEKEMITGTHSFQSFAKILFVELTSKKLGIANLFPVILDYSLH